MELTDGSGRWFDLNAATRIPEKLVVDEDGGVISLATGSEYYRETLYRTPGGHWILGTMSWFRGSENTVEEISAADADEWMKRQGIKPPPTQVVEPANKID